MFVCMCVCVKLFCRKYGNKIRPNGPNVMNEMVWFDSYLRHVDLLSYRDFMAIICLPFHLSV
jgi:hypothetical protein